MPSVRVAVVLPAANLITANQRIHHMVRATRTKTIRQAFATAAAGRAPLSGPVQATYTLQFPRGHRRDAPNWSPTTKAAVDGVVDAGVIPDDDDKHVTAHTFEAHTVDRTLPAQHVRLTVTLTTTTTED